MNKISAELEVEALESEFKPLTPQEAQVWRAKNSTTSPWRILTMQVVVAVVSAILVGFVTDRAEWAWSTGWGGLSVVLPAFLFSRALARQMKLVSSKAAVMSFFVWELVKVVLTVALLCVAPNVISGLSWLAMLAGFVVTLKVYWLGWYWSAIRSRPV
jgi:ATP synthase protein I